jgi:hypothetical protein
MVYDRQLNYKQGQTTMNFGWKFVWLHRDGLYCFLLSSLTLQIKQIDIYIFFILYLKIQRFRI